MGCGISINDLSFVFVGRVVEGGGACADPVLFEQVGCGLSSEHIQIYAGELLVFFTFLPL